MKRLWLVLLSMALVVALSASAFAVDVKLSGSFYAAGMYLDKTTLNKNTDLATSAGPGPSTAFYYQRLRVKTDFIVSPGLKLVTRFDAMERAWGAARSVPGSSTDIDSSGTRAENENIAFDWAYVEYTSPVGLFMVGIQDDGGWGTVFADSSKPQGIVTWAVQKNGWTAALQFVKMIDQSKTAIYPPAGTSAVSDNDTDKYQIAIAYEGKTAEAGVLGIFYNSRSFRPATFLGADVGMVAKVYVLEPYAKAKLGPVKIQAELDYAFGDVKYDSQTGMDVKVDNLVAWIDATVDLKQFYFGGTFAYVAGQDWGSYNNTSGVQMDKIKGGFLTGGMDWNPTLILFNNERQYWGGSINGHTGTGTYSNAISQNFGLNDTGMYNAWFFQGRAGFRPIDKLDILASVSYAKADNKTLPAGAVGTFLPCTLEANSDVYGTEVDVTATYKITSNLSYMIGAGYLFTGDYFKGNDSTAEVNNDYMVINKLTLTF